jgi:hypothetical protein
MGSIRVSAHGRFAPERFVRALTDFGPGRAAIWGNSSTEYLTVHATGETWAEVTEGSPAGGGIWQRYRYDWSMPDLVRLDVLDSNAFGPGSAWEYRLTGEPAGTRVDLFINRVPSTLRGRVLDALLLVAGRFFFARDLRRTIARIEATS